MHMYCKLEYIFMCMYLLCIWTRFPETPLYTGCGVALLENPLQALQVKRK